MKSTTTKKHIDELHSEIRGWTSDVKLIRDELKMYQFQLAEIISRNTNAAALRQGEHFQNQFIRQAEVTDELHHELNAADQALARKARGNSSSDHLLIADHIELREKMDTYNRIFSDLKTEYRSYRQEWF